MESWPSRVRGRLLLKAGRGRKKGKPGLRVAQIDAPASPRTARVTAACVFDLPFSVPYHPAASEALMEAMLRQGSAQVCAGSITQPAASQVCAGSHHRFRSAGTGRNGLCFHRGPARWGAFLMLAVGLFTAACSAGQAAEYLQFAPSAGETRGYQLYSHQSVRMDGGIGSDEEARMLLQYRVLGNAPGLSLHLLPRYVHLDAGRSAVSSVHGGIDRDGFRELMDGGFIVTLDAQTGEALAFEPGNAQAWQQLTDADPQADMLLEQLRAQMMQPGMSGMAPMRIPLREGARIEMPAAEGMPAVHATVDALTEKTVRLALSSDDADVRVAGFMLMARDGGWIERMALVLEMPLPTARDRGTLRQHVAMIRDDATRILPALDGLVTPDDSFRPIGSEPVDVDGLGTPLRDEQIFPSQVGTFDFEGFGIPGALRSEAGPVAVRLGHRVRDPIAFGRLVLSEIEARDVAGDLVDVPLQAGRLLQIPPWQNPDVESRGLLFPLGWGIGDALKQVAEIRATASYTPIVRRPLRVPLHPTQAQRFEVGDAWMTVTPLQEMGPGAFEFRFKRTEDAGILWALPPELRAQGRMQPPAMPHADWLTPTDVAFLGRVHGEDWPQVLQVQFDTVPDALLFQSYESASTPGLTRAVRFRSPEQRHGDITLPPMTRRWLYPSDNGPGEGGDAMPTVVASHALQPEANDGRLSLTLSHVQAANCTLSVENGAHAQGVPLHWAPASGGAMAATQGALPPGQLRRSGEWELQTEDGERNHFHDIEVVSRLQCPGEGRWQRVDYTPGERPWLIDLAALAGDDKVDPAMSARRLLGRYRFLDESGKALALQPSRGDVGPLALADATLGDYLVDGQHLRIAGIPARIESLVFDGNAVDRRWTTDFDPLP